MRLVRVGDLGLVLFLLLAPRGTRAATTSQLYARGYTVIPTPQRVDLVGADKQAVKIDPESPTLHYQLGQAYLKAGQRAQAEKELSEAGKLQAKSRAKQEEKLSGRLPAPQAPEP